MIYEFKCKKCGNIIEKLTSNMNLFEVDCPKCGSVATRKISISNFNAEWLKRVRESNNMYVTKKE